MSQRIWYSKVQAATMLEWIPCIELMVLLVLQSVKTSKKLSVTCAGHEIVYKTALIKGPFITKLQNIYM